MKKAYIKPEIMFENFSLSTNIAGDCEFKTKLSTEGACGYCPDERDPNRIIFVDGILGCTTKTPDETDGVCYHVPYDGSELFNS